MQDKTKVWVIFEVFDSRSLMVSRSEFGSQDVWIMTGSYFAPAWFALLGSALLFGTIDCVAH